MNETTFSLNFCEALTIASWGTLSKVILLILKPSMVPQPRVFLIFLIFSTNGKVGVKAKPVL